MRQKIRRILLYVSLALFPVTMNFLSPYVSIDGAFVSCRRLPLEVSSA